MTIITLFWYIPTQFLKNNVYFWMKQFMFFNKCYPNKKHLKLYGGSKYLFSHLLSAVTLTLKNLLEKLFPAAHNNYQGPKLFCSLGIVM